MGRILLLTMVYCLRIINIERGTTDRRLPPLKISQRNDRILVRSGGHFFLYMVTHKVTIPTISSPNCNKSDHRMYISLTPLRGQQKKFITLRIYFGMIRLSKGEPPTVMVMPLGYYYMLF